MFQNLLFDAPAHARATDPQTSKAAAAKVKVHASWSIVADVLEILGVATSGEIIAKAEAMGVGISESRVRGSLSPDEMLGAEYVRIVDDAGKTKLGNPCQRYELTDLGRKELLQ